MTFQQAKDQVAKNSLFYSGWNEFQLRQGYTEVTFKALERAAELYAKSKWDEACEAQQLVYFDHVNNKARPEFKP